MAADTYPERDYLKAVGLVALVTAACALLVACLLAAATSGAATIHTPAMQPGIDQILVCTVVNLTDFVNHARVEQRLTRCIGKMLNQACNKIQEQENTKNRNIDKRCFL